MENNIDVTSPEQDQKPYFGDEAAPEGEVAPPPQEPILPLEGDPVADADAFESQRKSELDAAREEHNRRTAGGDPRED